MTRKLTPKQVSNQVARFAIDGAIEYGRQGINPPPTEDHWLMEYWQIGRQLAAAPQVAIARLERLGAYPKTVNDEMSARTMRQEVREILAMLKAVPEGELLREPDYKTFALAVLVDSRDNLGADIDGGMVQEVATKCGLLDKIQATKPCDWDSCACASYGPFPHDCYRYSKATLKAIAAASTNTEKK